MLSYEGLFFDKKTAELLHSLEENQLAKINNKIHCTFRYHPDAEEIFNDIVGKTFEITIIGYGNDGFNSGFAISLPDELLPYYINYEDDNKILLRTPHITTSLAIDAKEANTKNLNFKPLEKPIKIKGTFGYWLKDGNRKYLSYKPYYEKSIK